MDAWGRRKTPALKRAVRGLSAIELMVTLSVAAILMGIAVPSYTNLTATNRVKAVSSEIYLSLIRARSEAAKLNQSVRIAPKVPGTNWLVGWKIMYSGDDLDEILLYEQRTFQGSISGVTVSGGPTEIIYMSSGRISGGTALTFSIVDPDARKKRCVSVDLTGRPYVEEKEKADAC